MIAKHPPKNYPNLKFWQRKQWRAGSAMSELHDILAEMAMGQAMSDLPEYWDLAPLALFVSW